MQVCIYIVVFRFVIRKHFIHVSIYKCVITYIALTTLGVHMMRWGINEYKIHQEMI